MGALITYAGYAAILYLAYKVGTLVYQLMRPPKNLSSFGTWTVITGATDGIGKAMAFELAKKGQNLLIIGRNPEKLKKTVEEVKSKNNKIKVETLQIDLSLYQLNKDNIQDAYIEKIKNKDVGILINNAGLAYRYTNFFNEVDQQRVENMCYVNNVSSTILMQQTIKEKFLTKKTKSAIINISSAGSIVPHPLHVVYSATKSYLNKISIDLAREYASKKIFVQSQMPYFVVTNMSKIRKPSFTTPTAKDYAQAAVKQIGYNGVISPYPVHAVIFFFFDFIPDYLLNWFIYSLHFKIKKKGDKKFGKKQ
mmetsp:Transcript_41009/g.36179  ORF Transcript_41009/g.36179 Transcript_41009/m.36179 type:complete len:308 (-) Transcript_41009:43-966(-)